MNTKVISSILTLALFTLFIGSCTQTDDITPTVNIPNQLSIDDNTFYPEDIKIANNKVYVSAARNGSIVSFDLTQENPTAQTFAAAEAAFPQAWGLESDGNVLVGLLNNADFTGNPPGPSKLVEYSLSTGSKTNEWALPAGTVAHTVSIVEGKYYVTDVFQAKILEVDPSTGNVNENWFTTSQFNPGQGFLATTYDGSGGLYTCIGSGFWYLPITNGQAGTLQPITVSGFTGNNGEIDGSVFVASQNVLYCTENDVMDPTNAGVVYKLEFSNTTTATATVAASGFDDPSGVWYLENNGSEYLFVCESQFGSLFGLNNLETPFTIKIVEL